MADRPSQKALADFVSEAHETIEALDRNLARLEETRQGGEPDADTLNSVFRAAHSLKGLAALFGVERMTALAHALEDQLDELRMGRCQLDATALGLLVAAPPLFGRIIAEEAAQRPPSTAEEARELAARLRGGFAPALSAADTILEVALEDSVRSVLTDYEEHRLRANLTRGARVYRVRTSFDLATFDTALDELKERLEPIGEIVSTLPSPGTGDPNAISFDLLLASTAPIERARAQAGAAAQVEEIPRQEGVGVPPPSPGEAGRGPGRGEGRAEQRGGADDLGERAAREPAARPAAAPPAAEDLSLRSVSQAVRVDIRKLDGLMNLVGELVLLKTNLLGIAERLRSGEESTTLGLELHRESRGLERKLDELQGGILEVRMVPLGQIFDKLSRMVRKLARDLGKQVEFEVRGSEVELDKLIVEGLSDPLMHLIRNALDHAVEPPEERERAGKPPPARITLSAAQKGSRVLVSVEDDGAGIDERRVREVAVRRGFGSPEAVAQLSRRDALNLIFLPGFSTAREVTALSGRGVGMDVVKSNIAAMSGIIDLHTEQGKGTCFEITLPVTLAIVRALIVSAAGRAYAVPLNGVLEIVTVDPSELRTIEQREVISLRGSTLPLIRLGRFFGSPARPPPGSLFVVVVGLAQERLGIAVDALVGQQDVVVKPLGRALAGVRGIAGATDLGNRRTILVLDVGPIIEDVVHGERLVELAE